MAGSRGEEIFPGDAIFSGESLHQLRESPWALTLTKLNQFQKHLNSFSLIEQKNIVALSVHSGRFSLRVAEKRDSTKPRRSQAVTWAQENRSTRRSIFTIDLSKPVYRKFL